jgi:cytoskeletal protein CcmA (bactofilin family)
MAMFGDKKAEDQAPDAAGEGGAAMPAAKAVVAPPIMPVSAKNRGSVARPEIVRRAQDYASGPADDRSMGSYGDGKKLIVGREIALNGQISSCEKLVVEGTVEASMSECREIEIAETGIFKGEAEIEIAEIGGAFEGTIIATDLLIIRSTGRVVGSVRAGRLEVERGGEIQGDVQILKAE